MIAVPGDQRSAIMDIKQITYFLHLAETLNFTEAARRSGVAQPSLTRAIQRLEEELGGPLIYRDGKDSRLTMLGREVQAEFLRVASALNNVREHSENSVLGRSRVLDIAVASTIMPQGFSRFFDMALEQLPMTRIHVHALGHDDGVEALLGGRYHAVVLPRAPRPHSKLYMRRLYTERFHLAFAADHPLARETEIPVEALSAWPYVDRLACEFHTEITEHLMRRDAVMRPRYCAEREDWVQHMVAHSRAICIMPERSALAAGLAVQPVAGLDLARDVTLAAISGSGTPLELRKLLGLVERHDWSAVG